MPTLQRLVNRGVMGNLATLHPVLSPMLWTSIATGKRPFKHGMLGFVEPTPDGHGVRPVSGTSPQDQGDLEHSEPEGPALQRGRLVAQPSGRADPRHHGLQLLPTRRWAAGQALAHGTGHGPPAGAGRSTWPSSAFHPQELMPDQIVFFIPKHAEIDQNKDRRLAVVQKILAECTSVHAAATWLMAD